MIGGSDPADGGADDEGVVRSSMRHVPDTRFRGTRSPAVSGEAVGRLAARVKAPVPRTRRSHDWRGGHGCERRVQKRHWNHRVAGVLSIPKFAQGSLRMLANFGIGTLAMRWATRCCEARPCRWGTLAAAVLVLAAPAARADDTNTTEAAPPHVAACTRAASFRLVVDVGHGTDAPGALSARGV